MTLSLAPAFSVVLRNQSYAVVAYFDDIQDLQYSKSVNDLGSLSFSLPISDARCSLFTLDSIVQIIRAIPGCNLEPYVENNYLFRSSSYELSETGEERKKFTSVGLNDFLARTIINYPSGTIKAYKKIAAETAMKEYVNENCGSIATVVNGRLSSGVLPNFSVVVTTGAGIVWEGDRASENLLDVLKDIAKFSSMDFSVLWDALSNAFTFDVYAGQLGLDRTIVGLSAVTGKNSAGHIPVVFSKSNGNVQKLTHDTDRTQESNVVMVLGDGDGATRTVVVRSSSDAADSPWNRREISRPKTGFLSEMQTAGDEALKETKFKDTITFTPLQQPTCLYGRDYFVGDKITFVVDGVTYNKRISSVTNTVKDTEGLSLEIAEIS